MPLEQDEVVERWGLSKNLNRLKNRNKEVILSSYDIGYLDVGFGNRNGANYASYIKWRNIYALRRIWRESGSSEGGLHVGRTLRLAHYLAEGLDSQQRSC